MSARICYLALISVLALFSIAQIPTKQWALGNHAGVDFQFIPPINFTTAIGEFQDEAAACIGDQSGKLIIYTDGDTVWNKNHQVIANGTGLAGRWYMPAIIGKAPQSQSEYYIFTITEFGNSCNGADLRFSKVDISLASGQGSVTVKNVLLHTTPRCSISAVLTTARHCNGTDFWVITPEDDSSAIVAYHVSATGINMNPVRSKIFPMFDRSISSIAVSPNGKKIAFTIENNNTGYFRLAVADFDNSTGIVSSNPTLLTCDYRLIHGCEFSSDGSKLYAAPRLCGIEIFQWDLCAASDQAINASKTNMSLPLGPIPVVPCIEIPQLAPDGKIYFPWSSHPGTIAAVHHPNLAGTSCSVDPRAIVLVPQKAGALPNMPNDDLRNIGVSFSPSLTCRQVGFQAPAHMQPGCAFSQNTPLWIKWDFGEPAAPSTNTSTALNPSHLYASTGTYTVKLVASYKCYNDTFVKTIQVLNPGPAFTASGNFTICPGQKAVISLSGNYQYQWSGNLSGNTVTLSPSSTTFYNVTATDSAGCSASKLLEVTVSDCIGLEDGGILEGVSLYPNPANEFLTVKSDMRCRMELVDQLGKVVLLVPDFSGMKEIRISHLPPGVYFAKLVTGKKTGLVKVIRSAER